MWLRTMKKLFIYLTVFTGLFVTQANAEDDIDAMLFAPAPKITAAKPARNVKAQAPQTSEPLLLLPAEIDKNEVDFDNIEPALTEEIEETNARLKKAPPSPKPSAAIKQVQTRSLTDTIKSEGEEIDGNVDDKNRQGFFEGTWVEKLANTSFAPPPSDLDEVGKSGGSRSSALETMVQSSKGQNERSNASVFDVSGIMLRMTLTQVDAIMLKRGYKLVSQKFEIPNFIKWRFEEECRNAGVVGYERLAACVVKAAKENKHQYVESAKFVRYDTQEDINVFFTSNFTNNKVYKVIYNSAITNAHRGSGQKAQYLRDIKVFDFWRQINRKYGVPDNKEDVIWGMGGNKPYMKASTGYIMLEDPMLKELDYTRMSREDQKFINTGTYNF